MGLFWRMTRLTTYLCELLEEQLFVLVQQLDPVLALGLVQRHMLGQLLYR